MNYLLNLVYAIENNQPSSATEYARKLMNTFARLSNNIRPSVEEIKNKNSLLMIK